MGNWEKELTPKQAEIIFTHHKAVMNKYNYG
jgi:hypothetical protein